MQPLCKHGSYIGANIRGERFVGTTRIVPGPRPVRAASLGSGAAVSSTESLPDTTAAARSPIRATRPARGQGVILPARVSAALVARGNGVRLGFDNRP